MRLRALRAAPLAIFLAHLAGLLAIFDPVGGAFDASPILEQDWGTHFFHVASREAFERDGRASGYNPWFMGGYASNTIHDASIRLFEVSAVKLARFARFVSGEGAAGAGSATAFDAWRAFKWIALAFAASVPLAGAAAGRALASIASTPSTESTLSTVPPDDTNAEPTHADLAAALLSGLWTLSWWNSLPREMFFYGMVGFATAPFFAVWTVAAVARAMSTRSSSAAFDCSTSPRLRASASRSRSSPLASLASHAFAAAPDSARALATLFVLLAILPAMHLQAAILAAPSAVLLWFAIPASRPRAAFVVGVVLLAWLVNIPWISTFLRHASDGAARELVEAAPVFTTRPGDFFRDYFTAEGLWTFRTTPFEKGLRWALIVAAVASCAAGSKARKRSPATRLALALWIGVLWCGWLAYFGSSFESIRAWQPLRFKVGMDLFLAALVALRLPEAIHRRFRTGSRPNGVVVRFGVRRLAAAFRWERREPRPLAQPEPTASFGPRSASSMDLETRPAHPATSHEIPTESGGEPPHSKADEPTFVAPRGAPAPSALVALAALALGAVCAVVAILATEFPRDPARSMRLRTRFHPTIHRLLERIESDTPPDTTAAARILFEVSGDESGFAHDGSYLSAFLPSLARRACIGGPANLYNDRRQSINFVAGRLLGRPIESIPPRELESILDAYAIGSAVVFTEESRRALEALPGRFRAVATVGPFLLLANDVPPGPPGWFASGEGKVTLDWNRIECRDVRPGPDGRAILKCNWVEGLVVEDLAAERLDAEAPRESLAELEPVRVEGALEPFIAIEDPPASFALRLRGR